MKNANTPLSGKRVLVACSPLKAQALIQELASLGAEVLPLRVAEMHEIADKSAVAAALAHIQLYDWIVFTSSYGVIFFSKYMDDYGADRALRSNLKVCAIGPATAETAREHGFKIELVPDDFLSEGIVQAFRKYNLQGTTILLPNAKESRDTVPEELIAAGARVEVLPCYETISGALNESDLKAIEQAEPDLLVFTSSAMVRHFVNLLGVENRGKRLLNKTTVAVIGPITARAVESHGKTCEIVPAENTIPALVGAIREYYLNRVG
jgi:uroporphyrinogen III methyltransferase/synthase